ncbi:hypothetical protein ACFW2D_00430 [Streptomyces sp. NPDC058914]|uniref:hypothetical protein n=1 Tax=Streptomyces sp. NPDC058914 TaxID=3346671 RepID=UPI0036A5243C
MNRPAARSSRRPVRSYGDVPTIVDCVRDRLLVLPGATVVHTGHGDTTTVAAEAPQLWACLDRGF